VDADVFEEHNVSILMLTLNMDAVCSAKAFSTAYNTT
jgi:hypothetical protein